MIFKCHNISNNTLILVTALLKNPVIANSSDFSDEKLCSILNELISYAYSAGADFIEIFLENSSHIGILSEHEQITSVNPNYSKGAGIRVFKNNKDGFFSTNDLTYSGLIYAIDQSLGMLGLVKSDNSSAVFKGLNNLSNYGKNKENWEKSSPDINEISEKLIFSAESLKKHAQHVQSIRGNYSRSIQEILIASSDGTFARDIRHHQSYGINLISADKSNISSIGRRYGITDSPAGFREWNVENTSTEIAESSKNMLYADYVDASQMPVVLANKFGGVIFHEACGHLLETTQIERGTTPFLNMLDKKIAHSSVTAVDEGLTNGAFGSLSIDDEGMEPERTVLIKDGILKRFLSDRAGNLRTGHPRTGSGRRQNYSFPAASRMRNTYICPGRHTPSDLISSVDKGLYCKSMGGGSVGPTGQFNFAVEEGYLIENGKLTKPVKGATLIGEAKEIMPRISMCANDLDLAAGFCGSVSGSVNVTVGQPHIKVDSITIGGR